MKKMFTLLFSFACSLAALAQNDGDSATFFLHKFAQHIGQETYHIKKQGTRLTYDIDFAFTDRGSPVPLKATLVTSLTHEPEMLNIKGSTSRMSVISDSIVIGQKEVRIRVNDSSYTTRLAPLSFPVAGYAPGTVQMILLKYWKKHGSPKSINLLPEGKVGILREGTDTVAFNNKKLLLDRYIISGLIWGNEIAWTDKQGNLVCLITNDAEGDKLEMMNAPYESLLPELIGRAATYGTQLFSRSMNLRPNTNAVTAITGANIIDVESGNTLRNQTILIEGGIIKATGPAAGIKIPANASIINATGKTIVPGLWDMHAHYQQAEWGPAYLAAGVTTVRDCGNEFVYINAIKSAVDAKRGIGPFIIKAGIIDGPGPYGLGIVRASDTEEALNAVRMYKDNGFAQIKIYSSVQPAMVKVIADETHRLGLTLTGHVPQTMTTQAGIDSGMDQINHVQYVFKMLKKDKDGYIITDDSTAKAAFAFLKAHNTVIDPTLGVYEMIFRNLGDDIRKLEPNFYKLPLPLQSLFKNTGMPDSNAKAYAPMLKSMRSLIKLLHDNGITFMAGTDMGFPGYSLPGELELYVQNGLTPLEALRTATIIPAQVMKMDQERGTIAAGKKADLLILDADPLVDISNLRKLSIVFKEGQRYDPAVLHAMVGFGK